MGYGEKFWHFESGGLPAEFTAITGGNASVSVADHGILLDSGTGTAQDAAAVWWAFDRGVANYQRITACVRASATVFRTSMRLMYTTTPPAAAPLATVNGNTLIQWYTYLSGSWYGQARYWDPTANIIKFSDTSKTWSGTNAGSTPAITADDDYHVFGFDFDNVQNRIRCFWVHVATGTTFAYEPTGPKIFCLTDWVALTSIRNGDKTSDLYLSLGWLENATSDLAGATQHIEWVRHEWADELIPTFVNQKVYNNGTGYNVKLHTCLRPDGIKLPDSRTGVALAVTAAAWDSAKVGQWGSVVRDPVTNTYWMSYNGSDGTGQDIGIASATDPFGVWTKYASNPVIPDEIGVDYGTKLQNCLVLDRTEPDPAKRWKMVVSALSDLDGHIRVYLYTAAQPDTTAWTLEGLLLDWNSSNLDGDSGPELYAPPVYLGGRWYLHYVGLNGTPPWYNYVAVGDRLAAGAFTPIRTTNFLDSTDGVEMTITTGSGTSRTVGVNSTTGVAVDDFVMYDQDSSTNNWQLSRVRKILSSTQLELYHRIPGLSTSGVLRTLPIGKTYAHHLMPYGDEWLWASTAFATMFGHATFSSGYEGSAMYRSTNPPYQEKPTYDRFNSPGWWLGRDNNTGSTENPRFISSPVHPYTQALQTRRQRRDPRLRR